MTASWQKQKLNKIKTQGGGKDIEIKLQQNKHG